MEPYSLDDFVKHLRKLQDEGHGDKKVFYRHSASGDCGTLAFAHVTSAIGEFGPFDLAGGEEYISISADN